MKAKYLSGDIATIIVKLVDTNGESVGKDIALVYYYRLTEPEESGCYATGDEYNFKANNTIDGYNFSSLKQISTTASNVDLIHFSSGVIYFDADSSDLDANKITGEHTIVVNAIYSEIVESVATITIKYVNENNEELGSETLKYYYLESSVTNGYVATSSPFTVKSLITNNNVNYEFKNFNSTVTTTLNGSPTTIKFVTLSGSNVSMANSINYYISNGVSGKAIVEVIANHAKIEEETTSFAAITIKSVDGNNNQLTTKTIYYYYLEESTTEPDSYVYNDSYSVSTITGYTFKNLVITDPSNSPVEFITVSGNKITMANDTSAFADVSGIYNVEVTAYFIEKAGAIATITINSVDEDGEQLGTQKIYYYYLESSISGDYCYISGDSHAVSDIEGYNFKSLKISVKSNPTSSVDFVSVSGNKITMENDSSTFTSEGITGKYSVEITATYSKITFDYCEITVYLVDNKGQEIADPVIYIFDYLKHGISGGLTFEKTIYKTSINDGANGEDWDAWGFDSDSSEGGSEFIWLKYSSLKTAKEETVAGQSGMKYVSIECIYVDKNAVTYVVEKESFRTYFRYRFHAEGTYSNFSRASDYWPLTVYYEIVYSVQNGEDTLYGYKDINFIVGSFGSYEEADDGEELDIRDEFDEWEEELDYYEEARYHSIGYSAPYAWITTVGSSNYSYRDSNFRGYPERIFAGWFYELFGNGTYYDRFSQFGESGDYYVPDTGFDVNSMTEFLDMLDSYSFGSSSYEFIFYGQRVAWDYPIYVQTPSSAIKVGTYKYIPDTNSVVIQNLPNQIIKNSDLYSQIKSSYGSNFDKLLFSKVVPYEDCENPSITIGKNGQYKNGDYFYDLNGGSYGTIYLIPDVSNAVTIKFNYGFNVDSTSGISSYLPSIYNNATQNSTANWTTGTFTGTDEDGDEYEYEEEYISSYDFGYSLSFSARESTRIDLGSLLKDKYKYAPLIFNGYYLAGWSTTLNFQYDNDTSENGTTRFEYEFYYVGSERGKLYLPAEYPGRSIRTEGFSRYKKTYSYTGNTYICDYWTDFLLEYNNATVKGYRCEYEKSGNYRYYDRWYKYMFTDSVLTGFDKNVTLYAVWLPYSEYVINSNGGTFYQDGKALSETTITRYYLYTDLYRSSGGSSVLYFDPYTIIGKPSSISGLSVGYTGKIISSLINDRQYNSSITRTYADNFIATSRYSYYNINDMLSLGIQNTITINWVNASIKLQIEDGEKYTTTYNSSFDIYSKIPSSYYTANNFKGLRDANSTYIDGAITWADLIANKYSVSLATDSTISTANKLHLLLKLYPDYINPLYFLQISGDNLGQYIVDDGYIDYNAFNSANGLSQDFRSKGYLVYRPSATISNQLYFDNLAGKIVYFNNANGTKTYYLAIIDGEKINGQLQPLTYLSDKEEWKVDYYYTVSELNKQVYCYDASSGKGSIVNSNLANKTKPGYTYYYPTDWQKAYNQTTSSSYDYKIYFVWRMVDYFGDLTLNFHYNINDTSLGSLYTNSTLTSSGSDIVYQMTKYNGAGMKVQTKIDFSTILNESFKN